MEIIDTLFDRGYNDIDRRVCYVDFVFAETVYLITVYGKKDKDNLSKEERNNVKKVIEALRKTLGGGFDE